MIKKLLKTGLSITLTLLLVIFSSTTAFSKTIYEAADYQQTVGTSALELSGTSYVNYEDANKLAQKKASVLTSFYGETSVQYALIDEGKIVISGQSGVYSKNSKTALTENNMYGIGSISKIFTTVAVMQLVEQGKVELDAPVTKYIPEFTMDDPRYKDITVRMLLNHSSGLMGSSFNNTALFDDNDNNTYQNILNQIRQLRLKADPGEFSVYCNDGFTLAELLVEKVTGMSFTNYIKNNISDPLGLANTKTPQDSFQKFDIVKTYASGTKNDLPTDTFNMIGAGGIYSSAQNLCNFADVFMKDSNSKVLSEASADAMEKEEYKNGLWPKEGDSIISYGLGWDSVNTYPFTQYGIKALVKGGDTLLFHGSLVVLPEEHMAMAVLSSGGTSAYNQIMAQEILLSALKAKGSIKEILPNKTFPKPVKASMPESEQTNSGYYANYTGVFKVDIGNEGILKIIDAADSMSVGQKFTYTGDGKFYNSDGSVYISFVDEKNGNTYLYISAYSTVANLGQISDSEYQAQKLKKNQLPDDVKKAWKEREYKGYLLISEKYSSEVYSISSPFAYLPSIDVLEGYCNNSKIIDSNHAESVIQIPGVYGRDLSDVAFYTQGTTEYMKSNGSLYVQEDSLKNLSTKGEFTSKIESKGYAHWYKIGKKSVGKKIKITIPDKASFTVYDSDGVCINNSWISKQDTVTLPKDGYIVFAGAAKTEFNVKYIK